ncbi:MAG: O-antigen ligase family protein [Syntrophotaleaceae bacterium]
MEKTESKRISREGKALVGIFVFAALAAMVFSFLGPVNFLLLSSGIAVMTAVLLKPFYGLCFLAVSIPYAGILQIAPKLTANKAFAVWVVLSFLLGLLVRKENLKLFSSFTLRFYIVLHVYLFVSFPFRTVTQENLESLFSKIFLLGLVFLIAAIPVNFREFRIICLVSAAGSALLGIYIALFGMEKVVGEYGTRLAAGTNENVLAHALGVGLLLSFFAMKDADRKIKGAILFLDVFSVYAILLTGSRGTWLALVLSVALFPLFAPGIPLKKRLQYILSGILTVGIISGGLIYGLFGQWGQLVMDRLVEHDTMAQAAGGRVSNIWPFYLGKFSEKPFFGWGPGASEYLGMSAHNDFLWSLVEMGGVGFILLLLFLAFALKEILANRDTTLRLQALILFTFLLLAGLTHNTLSLKSYALAWGALCFLAKLSVKQEIQPRPTPARIQS